MVMMMMTLGPFTLALCAGRATAADLFTRRGADALTDYFCLPLKWLARVLDTFHNNYIPPVLVWIYRLTLTPVFRPTYLTHGYFC